VPELRPGEEAGKYPPPLVDHATARRAALAAFASLKTQPRQGQRQPMSQ
jgi:hypothetical protein